MALDPVDLLLDNLVTDGGRWPHQREALIHTELRTHRAFLDSDRATLRLIAGWSGDRDYKVDPLAGLIADAWADHIFGEDLGIEAANTSDTGALEGLLTGNDDLAGELHQAERVAVGEGETWWRVYRDEDIADVPLLEWHTREHVLPLYVGRRLLAAALVTELAQHGAKGTVWRHLEVHADAYVEHVLFRGTATRIGQTVPLENHPDLEALAAALPGTGLTARRWTHGLPMLMGRVLNGRGQDRRLGTGVSDFKRISDFLLDLNEAATIGAENARLTAKRRVIVPEESLRRGGPELTDNGLGQLIPAAKNSGATFDAGEDVLVISALDRELGQDAAGAFKVLEYAFDAEALISYKRDLVETALTRVGLTPSYVGVDTRSSMGQAVSGTARRLMLTPTTKAGAGKARPWDDALPRILALMARLDALGVTDGGFGRPWTDPTTPPSVERADPLPADEVEEAQVEATLVQAGLRSRRTSVARQHPDWTAELIDEELARIADERPATSAASAFLA